MAGCRKRRLNQALSVLSLSLGFCWCMWYAVNYRDSFYVVLFFCYLCVLSLGCSRQVVSTSTSGWLERLASEMTYNVLMGTLNPTHSLTHSPVTQCCLLWRATLTVTLTLRKLIPITVKLYWVLPPNFVKIGWVVFSAILLTNKQANKNTNKQSEKHNLLGEGDKSYKNQLTAIACWVAD